MKFSVLISVYIGENSIFFNQALKSILIEQTRIPNEVVIVKDGPLTIELEEVIEKYTKIFPDIVKVINLIENRGLGEALKVGLYNCSNEIIARMDSDDISVETRFEKQIEFLKNNPDISVVGSYIEEFYDNPKNIKFRRVTPSEHRDIKIMLRRRNPMNHVTVMFRKSDLLKAGGYKHLPYLEDYYLWIRMIAKDFKMNNMQEVLVLVRTGENMYKRRSNFKYIKGWYNLQIEMFKSRFIKKIDIILNMINIIGFVYTPPLLKKYIYRYFLRSAK